jgi:hypothetical protein
MTGDENKAFEPPVTDLPKSRTGCLIKGCIVTVVVLFLLIGGCSWTLYSQKKKVEPICERYFRTVESENYTLAYDSLSSAWKKSQTKEQYIAFETAIRAILGGLKKYSLSGVFFNSANGTTVSTVNYTATYERGVAQVVFILKQYDEQYMIEGVRYDSENITSALKCVNCGAVQPTIPQFCSSCGREWGK